MTTNIDTLANAATAYTSPASTASISALTPPNSTSLKPIVPQLSKPTHSSFMNSTNSSSATTSSFNINGLNSSSSSSPSTKPGTPGFKNPHDKKGRSTSCYLCQKRKQKCDHRLPSCTTCIKAGIKCIQPAKYAIKKPEKDDYTIMLEKKIKFLEKVLDTNNIAIDKATGNQVRKSYKYKKFSPYLSDSGKVQHNSNVLINHNNYHQVRIPNDYKLPHLSINPPNGQFFQQQDNSNNLLSIESIDFHNSLFFKYSFIKDFLKYDPIYEVDEKFSRTFLDIHFTRLHFKYPLLDEDEVFEFHNLYQSNVNNKGNLIHHLTDSNNFHYSCSRMWLIFAISSCLLKSTNGKNFGPVSSSERLFSTSIRHLSKCDTNKLSSLQKIEILTLTVLFLIRTDRDSLCLYELIKDCMQICVEELKLNKSQTYWNLLPKDRLKKMRIWWCVYLLDRMISIAVGKPYSLKESYVDSDLPLFELLHNQTKHHYYDVNFINQSIKLRRIESRFVEELEIINMHTDDQTYLKFQQPKVEKFFQELEDWRKNCKPFKNGIENETLRLYYYRSVRILIQPFLELMDPNDKLFKECQASAGNICQLFKVFHEKTVHGHSTTSISTVFSAGVTLIYCLWLARNKDDLKRKQLGDDSKHTRPQVSESLFNGLNDLRACSICLYVMTERSKFALIFRDTFDQLMNSTIGNLIERCGPDSSELIYNNEPGMPPAIVRKTNNHGNNVNKTHAGNNTNGLVYTGFGVENFQKVFRNPEELKLEQAERKIKQGQIQKNVPKSLSHLLTHSPPLATSSSNDYEDIPEEPLTKMFKPSTEIKRSTPSNEVDLNSFHYPTSTYATVDTVASTGSASSSISSASIPTPASSVSTSGSMNFSDLFNGRTNKMINNISVWTGESGKPKPNGINMNGNTVSSSLFDHSGYSANHLGVNDGPVGEAVGSNYLWNVPVEEFWANNDDYAFLA